jgi:hypothetical protein
LVFLQFGEVWTSECGIDHNHEEFISRGLSVQTETVDLSHPQDNPTRGEFVPVGTKSLNFSWFNGRPMALNSRGNGMMDVSVRVGTIPSISSDRTVLSISTSRRMDIITATDNVMTSFCVGRMVVQSDSIEPVSLCGSMNDCFAPRWVPGSTMVLATNCWYDRRTIKSRLFEFQSKLSMIKPEAFARSSLQSIDISRTVQILRSSGLFIVFITFIAFI